MCSNGKKLISKAAGKIIVVERSFALKLCSIKFSLEPDTRGLVAHFIHFDKLIAAVKVCVEQLSCRRLGGFPVEAPQFLCGHPEFQKTQLQMRISFYLFLIFDLCFEELNPKRNLPEIRPVEPSKFRATDANDSSA